MATAGLFVGGIMILIGVAMIFNPGLIPGFSAANNCPLNEGVNINVSPSAVAPNGALSLSGGVFPASGACTLAGSTVYYGIVSGAQGSAVSSSQNGQWTSGVLAPGNPGTYTILASLCAYPHTSCNVCTEPSGACIDGSATFTVSNNPPPTYSITPTFTSGIQANIGQPVQGVFVVVSQGSQSFGTCISNSAGQCSVANLAAGTYLLSYQPPGAYYPGSQSYTVSNSITPQITLFGIPTTTTTTTAVSTTWSTTYTTLPPTTTTLYTTGSSTTGTCVSFGIFQNSITVQPGAAVSFSFSIAYPVTITGTVSIQSGQGQGSIQLNQGAASIVSGTVGGGSGSYTFNQNLQPGSYQILIGNGAILGLNAQTFSGTVQAQCSYSGGNGFNFNQLLPYGLIFGGAIVVAGSSGGRGGRKK